MPRLDLETPLVGLTAPFGRSMGEMRELVAETGRLFVGVVLATVIGLLRPIDFASTSSRDRSSVTWCGTRRFPTLATPEGPPANMAAFQNCRHRKDTMQEQRGARAARRRRRRPLYLALSLFFFLSPKMKFGRVELISSIVSSFKGLLE